MNVHTYKTSGGKDLIIGYIKSLSKPEIVDGLSVLENFEKDKTEKTDSDIVIKRAKELEIKLAKKVL